MDMSPQSAASNEEKFRKIIADEAGIDPAALGLDSKLVDLDISSVDRVMMLFEIETAFDVEIAPEEVEGLETIGEMLLLIESKRAA